MPLNRRHPPLNSDRRGEYFLPLAERTNASNDWQVDGTRREAEDKNNHAPLQDMPVQVQTNSVIEFWTVLVHAHVQNSWAWGLPPHISVTYVRTSLAGSPLPSQDTPADAAIAGTSTLVGFTYGGGNAVHFEDTPLLRFKEPSRVARKFAPSPAKHKQVYTHYRAEKWSDDRDHS